MLEIFLKHVWEFSFAGVTFLIVIYIWLCAAKIFNLIKDIKKILADSDLVEALKESVLLAHAWENFDKTLTKTPEKIYSTTDAAEFFNPQNLTRGMNMSFWQAYGGIFTGLGILGTFAGLTFGLSGVDMTSGDIETLKSGIAQLLSGVESAFVTSLVGIGAALIYSFVHHALLKSFQSNIKALAEKLDKKFPRRSIEDWLAESHGESRNQTTELKNIGGQVATENSWLEKNYSESQNQTTELQTISADIKNIGGQVAIENSWLEKNYSELQNQTTELQTISADIKNIDGQVATENSWLEKNNVEAQNQTTELQNISADIKNIGEQVAEAIYAGLDEKLGTYVDKICAAIDKLGAGGNDKLGEIISDRVGSQMDRFSAALNKFSDDIDEKLKATNEISKIMNEQLLNTLKELNESLRRQAEISADERNAEYKKFSEALESLIGTLNELAGKIKTQQENTAKDFETLLKSSLDNFNAVMAQMLANANQQRQSDAEQNKQTSEQFLATLAGLSKTLQEVAENSKNQQKNSADNFDSIIKNLIENLERFTDKQKIILNKVATSNATQISEAVKAFRKIVDAHNETMQKTFAHIQNHLAETEEFLRHINSAGTSLKQAAEPVRQSTLQLTKNLSETSAQMNNLATANRTTRENLFDLTTRLSTFVNNFNSISDELERSTKIIKDSLEHYNSKMNDGMTKNLTEFDKRITDAVGHLQSLVQDLSDDLDNFNRKRR